MCRYERNESVWEVCVELFCILVLKLREYESQTFSILQNPCCILGFCTIGFLRNQVRVWTIPCTAILKLECWFCQVLAIIVSQQGLAYANIVRCSIVIKLSVFGLIRAASQANELVKT